MVLSEQDVKNVCNALEGEFKEEFAGFYDCDLPNTFISFRKGRIMEIDGIKSDIVFLKVNDTIHLTKVGRKLHLLI